MPAACLSTRMPLATSWDRARSTCCWVTTSRSSSTPQTTSVFSGRLGSHNRSSGGSPGAAARKCAQCFRGRFPAGVRELIVDGLQGGGGDRDGGRVAAEIAGKGCYGRNRAGHRRDDVVRTPIEGQPLAGFHGLPDFQGRRRPAPGRAGVQECDRCPGRDNLRPRESGRQGGVTQTGLAKAKECFHLTIHPSEQDGKKSPPPRRASEHHVALGALHRARPVFRVAADALLVQGVGALGNVRVALLRVVALRAGCGLVVFVLG